MAVKMNALDATLDIELGGDGTLVSKLSQDGFGYTYGGARAAVGITHGVPNPRLHGAVCFIEP
jgi:hypothetical protein